jgi:cell division transport system ATP-binding protein
MVFARKLCQRLRRPVQKARIMIEFKDVTHDYGGGPLFADVSVSLDRGSFHFLTGPSGAGKSTFLKLCYGELLPSRGTVTLGGTDLRKMSRDDLALMRASIGVVHQDCQFLDHLSIRANVSLPIAATGGAVKEDDVDDLLTWVGLQQQADALPPTLSGGERQRAALARAVIAAPRVLLADEPTGNLDWDMSQRLLSLMIELNKMGTAVLIATHDMNLIRTAKSQVSARVLRIAGRKLQSAGADL